MDSDLKYNLDIFCEDRVNKLLDELKNSNSKYSSKNFELENSIQNLKEKLKPEFQIDLVNILNSITIKNNSELIYIYAKAIKDTFNADYYINNEMVNNNLSSIEIEE